MVTTWPINKGCGQIMSVKSLKEYDYHTVVCCGNCKCFNKEMYMHGDSGFCEVHQTTVERHGVCRARCA